MRYAEFRAELQRRRDAVRELEGSNDFAFTPASPHDRRYLVPSPDGVSVHAYVYARSVPRLTLNLIDHFRLHGQREIVDWSELDSYQLKFVAEVKAWIEQWMNGTRDELPPST